MEIRGGDEITKTTPIIKTKDLAIGYDEVIASGINLTVMPGEIISIVGPSGIGKTTLLRTLAGLISPINRTELTNLDKGELGYIPQRLGLVRHASVNHNVMLGAIAGSDSKSSIIGKSLGGLSLGICGLIIGNSLGGLMSPLILSIIGIFIGTLVGDLLAAFFYMPNKLSIAFTNEAIRTLGLEDKIDEPIRRLSGGQQRRVATARTLAQKPKLILADEFLSELDETNIEIVSNAVKNYVMENNAALVIVEHDIERARELSTRMLRFEKGKLIDSNQITEAEE